MPTKERLRTLAVVGCKLAFSAVLLWIVLRHADLRGVLGRLEEADWHWAVLGMACGPLALLLSALRWQVLSQGLLTRGAAVRYAWIGLFYGSVLPGAVSGDIAKGIALAAKRPSARDRRLAVSILFDRALGLWTLLFLFLGAAAVLWVVHPEVAARLHRLIALTCIVLPASLTFGASLLHPAGIRFGRRAASALPGWRLREEAERALDCVEAYAAEPGIIAAAVALSLAAHAVNILGYWLGLRALAVPAGGLFPALLYPLLCLLLAAPVSISGIGVRDVFFFGLFRVFGFTPAAGVAFSWLVFAWSIPVIAAGGLLQIWETLRAPVERRVAEAGNI
ncbi:MAG TPA: lysylphosphatidylglycerol synthase transmembrane domain-containing protein [Opitutaceae bacterium]|nr:lysylphosphatidylglycerol synthase transmembrane domain-containing protein [Opitutaceae bacterium]